VFKTFYLGYIRLHILYHATKETVWGLDLIRELGRHGYTLSPGTIYPILHGLEKEGFLHSDSQLVNGKIRKCYTATEKGKHLLTEAYNKTRELLNEIEEDLPKKIN
jgi:PadR family transcriptional regulator, regulatory protein PadR